VSNGHETVGIRTLVTSQLYKCEADSSTNSVANQQHGDVLTSHTPLRKQCAHMERHHRSQKRNAVERGYTIQVSVPDRTIGGGIFCCLHCSTKTLDRCRMKDKPTNAAPGSARRVLHRKTGNTELRLWLTTETAPNLDFVKMDSRSHIRREGVWQMRNVAAFRNMAYYSILYRS
jgi:hypothetical protein